MEKEQLSTNTRPETILIVAVVILGSFILFSFLFLAPLALGLFGIF